MIGKVIARVRAFRDRTPNLLCLQVNDWQDRHNVFATQTHYDPDAKEWVAFVFYREPIFPVEVEE